MGKIKIVITGAGGGGANNIISTIKEREKYHLIGFDISPYKVARANVDSRFVVPIGWVDSMYLRKFYSQFVFCLIF